MFAYLLRLVQKNLHLPEFFLLQLSNNSFDINSMADRTVLTKIITVRDETRTKLFLKTKFFQTTITIRPCS